VIQLVPFVVWLAFLTSAVMLILLWPDIGPRSCIVLPAWFLIAGYLQVFGHSMSVSACGLALQTLLAVYLIVCWRLTA